MTTEEGFAPQCPLGSGFSAVFCLPFQSATCKLMFRLPSLGTNYIYSEPGEYEGLLLQARNKNQPANGSFLIAPCRPKGFPRPTILHYFTAPSSKSQQEEQISTYSMRYAIPNSGKFCTPIPVAHTRGTRYITR